MSNERKQYDGWRLSDDGESMCRCGHRERRERAGWCPAMPETDAHEAAIFAYLKGEPGPWTVGDELIYPDEDGTTWTRGRERNEVVWHNDMEPSCQRYRLVDTRVEFEMAPGEWRSTDTEPRAREAIAHFWPAVAPKAETWVDEQGDKWVQGPDRTVMLGSCTWRQNHHGDFEARWVPDGEWESWGVPGGAWHRGASGALAHFWPEAAPVEKATPAPPVESGGRKDDSEKNRVDLLPFDALEEVAQVLTLGARKYSDRNWEKGMAWHRPFGALMRHMWAWWRGEAADPETGRSHLAHAACCVLFLLTYELRKIGTDDRP